MNEKSKLTGGDLANLGDKEEEIKPPSLEEIIFSCDMCEFTTNARYTLRNHKESHHEGRRFYCERCDFSALYKTSLNRHVRRRHLSVPFPCTKCEFSTTTGIRLRKHMKIHHAPKKPETKKVEQGNII